MDQNFVAIRARLHYLLREKYESLKGLDCGHSVSYSGILKLDGAGHIYHWYNKENLLDTDASVSHTMLFNPKAHLCFTQGHPG